MSALPQPQPQPQVEPVPAPSAPGLVLPFQQRNRLYAPDDWGVESGPCGLRGSIASADYECRHGRLPNQYGPDCTPGCWS